jgi:hypothetical protein
MQVPGGISAVVSAIDLRRRSIEGRNVANLTTAQTGSDVWPPSSLVVNVCFRLPSAIVERQKYISQ